MNWWFIIIGGVIVLDQLIKYVVVNSMFLGQSIAIVPNILHLTYILNAGAAFGILANQRIFFIAIAAVLIGIIVYFYAKILKLNRYFQLGIALLFGGAIGNMIDRIFIGKVIDYIDFRVWPIFNLADIAIVCGCIIIVYQMIFASEAHKVNAEDKREENHHE